MHFRHFGLHYTLHWVPCVHFTCLSPEHSVQWVHTTRVQWMHVKTDFETLVLWDFRHVADSCCGIVHTTWLIVVQAGCGARSIAVRSKEISVPFEPTLREHSSSATTNYVTRITCLHSHERHHLLLRFDTGVCTHKGFCVHIQEQWCFYRHACAHTHTQDASQGRLAPT